MLVRQRKVNLPDGCTRYIAEVVIEGKTYVAYKTFTPLAMRDKPFHQMQDATAPRRLIKMLGEAIARDITKALNDRT